MCGPIRVARPCGEALDSSPEATRQVGGPRLHSEWLGSTHRPLDMETPPRTGALGAPGFSSSQALWSQVPTPQGYWLVHMIPMTSED